MTTGSCPICGLNSFEEQLGGRDAYTFECKRCGTFAMTGRLLRQFRGHEHEPDDLKLRPYLSAYTKQTSMAGTTPMLGSENWRDVARAHMGTPVPAKVLKLLRLFETGSDHPGASVRTIPELDFPLLDAKNTEEMGFLYNHLVDLGYVEQVSENVARLTVKGWEQLSPNPSVGLPGRVFVAMSFADELDIVYFEGIAPALKDDCKLEPRRMKEIQHVDQITERIIAEIKLAQFMVADFTGQRSGVYFEAGYARGLGREVVWTCREDERDKLHFDTRQFNHVLWKTPGDLRRQLVDRVTAVILR